MRDTLSLPAFVLDKIARRRKPIRDGWARLRDSRRFDRRSINRRAYTIAWLDAEAYHAQRLAEMESRVTEAAAKAVQKEAAKWRTEAHIEDYDIEPAV